MKCTPSIRGPLAALFAMLLLSSSAAAAPARPSGTEGRPNILFLFADDHCYEAIRTFGLTDIDTPNLDRLAARGTVFTHAYNMGSWSGAVCVASRTMLITGRSLWDAHRVYAATDKEREAGRLWPQLLGRAGYDTYFTGKWHIRADANRAFDVARHVRPGMPRTVEAAYNRPRPGRPDAWSPYDKSLGGFWEGGTHWSEVVADDAIDFLETAATKDSPFFMYVAFNAPHDPRQAPKEYVDKYPPSRVDVPENFLPEYPHKDDIGCGPKQRDERLGPFPRTEHAVEVHRGEYYALITHMDAQIGRILDALETSGRADNTLVVFTADHGLAVGHHGLFGKQNMYDHSVRVPFMIAGPDVPKGKEIAAPIYLQDIMPTTLELAGVTKPQHVWFHSLLPLLRGETSESPYASVYGAYLKLQRSITADGYKLIVYPKAKTVRLYDLKDDPREKHDLADDAKSADAIRRLFGRLLATQKELGDALDLKAAFPELARAPESNDAAPPSRSARAAESTAGRDERSSQRGWTNLLKGNDLSRHWTTKGNWSIDDEGVVTLEPRPGEKGWARFDAYLWSKKKYDDFEIEFDYKVRERGNSGFYFNVGDKTSPVAKGIEVQIYDSHGKGEKKLTDHDSGGIIPGIPPKKNPAKPAGEWNRLHITVEGDKLTVRLNGELVNEVDLNHPRLKGRPDSGYIGFQDHALPLALRKIRIREL